MSFQSFLWGGAVAANQYEGAGTLGKRCFERGCRDKRIENDASVCHV